MKEKEHHRKAFEDFFKVGANLDKENVKILTGKYEISERTLRRWHQKLDWEGKAEIRFKALDEEIAKDTLMDLADKIGDGLKAIDVIAWKLLEELMDMIERGEDLPFHISNVKELEKVWKIIMGTQGRATTIEKVEVEIVGEVPPEAIELVGNFIATQAMEYKETAIEDE